MKKSLLSEIQFFGEDFEISVERSNDFRLDDRVEEVTKIVAPTRKNKVNAIAFNELRMNE